MKKVFNLFSKIFIMLWLLFIGVGNAYTAEVSITFSELGLSNGVLYTSFVLNDNISIEFGAGGNDGKYYNTGSAIRVYGGGHMSIIGSECIITKVNLVFGSGDGSNTINTNTGTYNNGEWTGSSNNVIFSVDGTSGHRRIATVTIIYNTDSVIPSTPYVPLDTITCDSARTAALNGKTDSALVKGFVTEIPYKLNNKISFWIADSINGGQIFEAYNASYDTIIPTVGDLVWIKGNLTKYNTTPEIIAPEFGIILRADVDTTSQDTTIIPIDPEPIDSIILPGITATMIAGTKANSATVNGRTAVKAGTKSDIGTVLIKVPANTNKLHLFAVAWNKESGILEVNTQNGIIIETNDTILLDDTGISGSGNNYELKILQESECIFNFDLTGVNDTTEIIFTRTGSNKRFVIWGATYETKSTPTDIETPQTKSNTYKIMKNGEIQIHRDNKVYNIYGNLVY